MNLFIGAVALSAFFSAPGFSYLSAPQDATSYTEKMAATIADRPECRKFKDAIKAHAKGSMAEGKTVGPIVNAKQQAVAAGCAK